MTLTTTYPSARRAYRYKLFHSQTGNARTNNMIWFFRRVISIPQAFILLGALSMVIYFSKYNAVDPNIPVIQVPEVKNVSQVTPHTPASSQVQTNHVQVMERCEANTSMTSVTDFASLPSPIKNFLLYRHCRHYPMLLDLPGKCGGMEKSNKVFLLLVIKSSPNNYDRREVLRKTWAKERMYRGVWIRRVFILGSSSDGHEKEKLNKLLQVEQEEFSDILQWDFHDTFHNLTLKQTLFLEWVKGNCPNVRFLFNGDDDVYANTDNMVEYLQSLEDNDGSKHLFTGYLFINEKVVRWSKSKYFIPVVIQETNTYPPYCGGGGYLLSGYTALVIYKMSLNITIHPIDDAYMGMCLEKAGLEPSSHIGVKTLGLNIPSKEQDALEPCYLRQLLLVHRFLPPEMYLMWKQVNDPRLDCSPSYKLK
ncbi:N-acetyllactosaminide beta-1,3-N-acetylglucosaminyltransferase 3-like [Kryptolebias marmoratus]|uniref:Hexosyltransferase n=1 Tax=Kryptolebias marmoratus TaxID=37003 RepID=A0A3Q2ZXV0_KRYMA|nr:N-acetyllactosaminide beta-1,3-N-acetylglucosaminyltransferase 3-like [Kryptolebias marmoratus]